jgi:antibiotic biosynthesis monooxygenase (ABM) superfamily enzyme
MIKRIWRGTTRQEDADAYRTLLTKELFPSIAAMAMAGYRGIELLTRNLGEEVEFLTIMTFETLDAVKAFVGDDIGASWVPPAARELLIRWDSRSRHYDVVEQGAG